MGLFQCPHHLVGSFFFRTFAGRLSNLTNEMKTKATIKNYRTWAAMMLGEVIIRAFDAHIRAFESYIWAHAQIYASVFLQIPLR